ncbi:MAG: hypothetical protein JJT89_05745 [Nitriliruptoraceae bacterium]|nr:hypothetical protein [Nitriliruptoraceae bacterium]
MDDVWEDLIQECERVVNALDGLPGVTLPPGAASEDISAAHEQLGMPLPTDLSFIMLLSDGIVLDHGLVRYLPVAPDAPPNIARFNDPDTWMWAYAGINPRLQDFLYYELTAAGNVVGFDRQELREMPETGNLPRPHLVVPLVPDATFELPPTVLAGLTSRTARLRETGELQLYHDDDAIIERFGPIPPDEILMPGPADFLDRFADASHLQGTTPVDAITALIARGEMHEQLLAMPEGSEVVGRESWQDERGRTRMRLLFS